ncbi:hypothetical protein FA95DRAFT_1558882 [Auriscalpium vulgare]|uniref:Uncharacterized protein n=1 Tax=Auriscalpium vulgare TaxID=40419 RepID=A0ACB8RUS5_9AGAM|nr:hypothetical protein FA95DRAFT_1558882 [Auriscalpium vulgare]
MTATTMHFGPEWMRPKHTSRPQNPSPPPNGLASHGPSSYSALVAAAPSTAQEKSDVVNPFKYSKEELLRIYKEGGGRGGLGLEVERWEGVVREVGSEPVGMKEWSDAERKLFSGPLNSEVRRRQSSDFLSPLSTQPGERPKLMHSASGLASPMRERFGGLTGRNRAGSDNLGAPLPRKLSLSSVQGPLTAARENGLSSPRTRGPLTPGFDGVLNSGETWTSRRRASESVSKANARGDSDTEAPNGNKLKIDEVEEEAPRSADLNGKHDETLGERNAPADRPPSEPPRPLDNSLSSHANGTLGTLNTESNDSPPANVDSSVHPAGVGPPGVNSQSAVPDLASIEWSYVDPQGQIQGPFRADLMQTWYDQGYFTPDLMMKRTKMDLEWVPVGEMARRAGNQKVFLAPLEPNPAPPGLPRRHDSPFDIYSPREAVAFNAPYQPIPTRSVQPSTLDSYFANNSPASNSPSSSFGAARFANGSPDPAAFGGRMGHMYSDSPVGSRQGSYAEPPANYGGIRRPGFNDSPFDQTFPMRSGLGNVGPARAPSVDTFGIGNQPLANQIPWSSPVNIHPGINGNRAATLDTVAPYVQHLNSGLEASFHAQSPLSRVAGSSLHQDGMGPSFTNISPVSQRDLARLGSRDPYFVEQKVEHQPGIGLGGYDGPTPSAQFSAPVQSQVFTQSPSLNYAAPSQVHPIGQSPGPITARQAGSTQSVAPTQPPWNAGAESLPKRTGPPPFDPNVFPTVRNTIATRQAQPTQTWPSARQPLPSASVEADDQSQQSPWAAVGPSAADEGWGQVQGPNSLTVSNLGQHNQQQEQEAARARSEDAVEPTPADQQQPADKTPATSSPEASPTQGYDKQRRKSSAALAADKASAPPAAAPAKAPSPTPASAKPVWATEAEKKQPAAPMSLREIQEAEAKKQEARKAAERAARASAASPQADEAQPFTASWGLPTSQVRAPPSSAKEVTSPPATGPASPAVPGAPAPVWTNAVKPPAVKKTMKEIQEEEEKRKKIASRETAAAAAARRAYAETTNKNATPTAAITGGAWTTVGSSGKAGVATVAATTARPALTPSSSTVAVAASSPRPTNGVAAVRTPVPAAVKAAPLPPKVEEAPVAPSAEFMKWLSDSLKGLNSSVNYEETASMLLSFPLDADATTTEIIAELVYDNSPTIDGRRFAQEFVTRRKADAVARKSGRAPSIADVVKAQPKASQQSEWGGFKVVNKKKKGGRA